MSEIRWYKGKWKVRIIQKSNVKGKHRPRNTLVEVLELIDLGDSIFLQVGAKFSTVPRLLWRKKREEKVEQ